MKRFRSLNIALVFFVFGTMMLSSLLSSILLIIVNEFEFLNELHATPTILPIFTLLVSTIIGTMLTIFVANKVLKPISELINATSEIAKGNFNIKIEIPDKPVEMAELVKSFNNMTNDLKGIELFRKDFINNFSHEFRTPIVSISGFAKQLKNHDLSSEQREEFTSIIIRESERLTNMASNVLLLTKLENQGIITDKKIFSLDEQIRNCILLLQVQWESKNIDFNLNLDSVNIYNNEEMLSHVWINLIGNAIKFSHNDSIIDINLYEDVNSIKIKIIDRGIGMTDETMSHIYDKFYQGDINHHTEGNGLGLALVKRIIVLCNGKISVKSKLNHGSEFIVKLKK